MYLFFQGSAFKVSAGDLGFSVTIYTITAICAVTLLMLRRSFAIFGNAELGGNVPMKYVSAVILVFLWFTYVTLSSLQAYGVITSPF